MNLMCTHGSIPEKLIPYFPNRSKEEIKSHIYHIRSGIINKNSEEYTVVMHKINQKSEKFWTKEEDANLIRLI